MSDSTPPSGPIDESTWDTAPSPRGSARGGRRRAAMIAAVSVAVVAILGGGAYAAMALFGGGSQPTEALPASTLAVMTVDLDPSATQKIAAIRTLRKFPGLKKQLGLGEKDDLRRYVFDKATADGACKGLDFAKDVKPWIGDRAAFGAVDLGGKSPAPVIALQVSDADKARAGIDAIVKCGKPGGDFGYTISGGYALISDSADHAKTIALEARKAPLSDDAAYKKWTDAAGGSGVMSFYVSRKAAGYFADHLDELGGLGLPGTDPLSAGSGTSSALPTELPTMSPMAYHPATSARQDANDPTKALKDSLKKFQGLAGTVRFADGGVEVEMAGGFDATDLGKSPVGAQVSRLPKDTALAVGLAVPPNYAKTMSDQITSAMGSEGSSMISEAESQLGITLPDDLQTLLGKSLTFSVGGNAPANLDDVSSPSDLPLGLTIQGDPSKIQAVVAKIEAKSGHSLDEAKLVTRTDGDRFTLATGSDYAGTLQKSGGLGDNSTFTGVVPHADQATAVVYVDFDSSWIDRIAEASGSGSGSDSAKANLAPLKALGLSTWVDGDTSHVLFKVTTD